MARTIVDIRAGLIEEMHLLQAEVDERCNTIYALDRAIAALTLEISTPRPELPSDEPEDAGDSEHQDSGNPFTLETAEWHCYEVLARLRSEIPVVEVWRQIRKATDSVIGRDTIRQALYNHPDVFFLIKQGWFRLRGR